MIATVKITIRNELSKGLPPGAYTNKVIGEKRKLTFQHIYDNYYGSGKSIYNLRNSDISLNNTL